MNLHGWMVGLTVGFAALAAGCGGDDSGGAPASQPGKVNEQAAKASAETAIRASLAAVNDNDGQGAAAQLQAAASQTQGIITPDVGAGAGARAQSGGPLAAGTCECTETSCTFQDCSESAGFSMNGTISWGGGNVKSDITYNVQSIMMPLTLTTKADLKVSATSIDGTLGSSGTADLSAVSEQAGAAAAGAYSWTANTTFKNVTYSSGGQATGGSIHVEATYNIAGQTYAGSADVNF